MEKEEARIVSPPVVAAPTARAVARMAGWFTGDQPLRLFLMIGGHRRIWRAWLPFASVLLLRGRLPRRDTELVILRTAWNCGSEYEWIQHAGLGRRAGVDPGTVTGRSPMAGSDHDRLLLQATDELHAARVMTERTWERLSAELSAEQRLELCFLVGHYEMLAMALNSERVEPEPTARARLDVVDRRAAEAVRDRLAGARDRLLTETV